MATLKDTVSTPPHYLPTMTQDYSRISDTAKAITSKVLPRITDYLRSIASQIAGMTKETPFVVADYGAADGANESALFEEIVKQIHAIHRSLPVRIFFIDIAEQDYFDQYWKSAELARLDRVEAQYIRRSFYEPFPELARKVHLGFSSTSLHWLDTRNMAPDFFRHPEHIQANQLPPGECGKFVEKWKNDHEGFLRERSSEMVKNGGLFLANLASFGENYWPASAGYNNLRDVCLDLYREGRISAEEMNAIFVPDYFATPEEMSSLLREHGLHQHFTLNAFEEMTIPCAYFTPVEKQLSHPQTRSELADKLAQVVRAWSASSIQTGLSEENKDKVGEIYARLRDKFYEIPQGLPYQYCLLELIKK